MALGIRSRNICTGFGVMFGFPLLVVHVCVFMCARVWASSSFCEMC